VLYIHIVCVIPAKGEYLTPGVTVCSFSLWVRFDLPPICTHYYVGREVSVYL
jgi:hypothetical protein